MSEINNLFSNNMEMASYVKTWEAPVKKWTFILNLMCFPWSPLVGMFLLYIISVLTFFFDIWWLSSQKSLHLFLFIHFIFHSPSTLLPSLIGMWPFYPPIYRGPSCCTIIIRQLDHIHIYALVLSCSLIFSFQVTNLH